MSSNINNFLPSSNINNLHLFNLNTDSNDIDLKVILQAIWIPLWDYLLMNLL